MTGIFSPSAVGLRLPESRVEIDRLALIQYAGAADDYVRQHWDHPFMTAQGYPDVIGHGWLTFAHMCRLVTDWAPPHVARIVRYAVRYQRPFHPGTLHVIGHVTQAGPASTEISLTAHTSAGDAVASGSVALAPIVQPGMSVAG